MPSTRNRSNKSQSNVNDGVNAAIVGEQIKNLGDRFQSEMDIFRKELERARGSTGTTGIAGENAIDTLLERFLHFEATVTAELKRIGDRVETMSSSLASLQMAVDATEQKALKSGLLVYGIEESSGSTSAADLIAKTLTCLNKHLSARNVNICEADISNAYFFGRKGNTDKPRPVLLEFTRIWCRDLLYFNKSAFKGSKIVISEVLTRSRHVMYLEAKRKFGKNCWTVNGSIFVHINGSRRRYNDATGELTPTKTSDEGAQI